MGMQASDVGRSCAFCGTAAVLTREHLFGDWLNGLGLDTEPVARVAGPLNGLPRSIGTSSPYNHTVRQFCAACNSGWMSRLEEVAKEALTPLLLGEAGEIPANLQGPLAMWVQKTALVAMLISSRADRESGYGLLESEYRALYAIRDEQLPLPTTSVWIGGYSGHRQEGVWVTPFVVDLEGLPEPERSHGYTITIALGQVILHAARFTALAMDLDLATRQGLPQLWPPAGPVAWPVEITIDDESIRGLAGARDLEVPQEGLRIAPWGQATNVADSELVGTAVRLPTVCHKHNLYYPQELMLEGLRGRRSAFIAASNARWPTSSESNRNRRASSWPVRRRQSLPHTRISPAPSTFSKADRRHSSSSGYWISVAVSLRCRCGGQ